MDHKCIVVGFVGIEKYEYILYLSRVLYHLGKKVLMIDCSENGALSACVPHPIETNKNINEYRGVSFSRCRDKDDKGYNWNMVPKNDLGYVTDHYINDFDCVLIDYGFCDKSPKTEMCNNIIFVVDQQEHNIQHIKNVKLNNQKVILIIKDFVGNRVTPDYISGEVGDYQYEQIYIAFQDSVDYSCKLCCQYENKFRFQRLSMQTKRIVKGITAELYPDLTLKIINVSYRKAERGE